MIPTKYDWIYQLYIKEQMNYKIGTRGPEVRQAQERLGCLVTGVFDTDTFRKITAFQAQNNIPQTGELDDLTYNTMFPPVVIETPVIEEVIEELQEEPVTKPKKENNASRN